MQGPKLDGVQGLYAGASQTCAVRANSTAACWGGGQPGVHSIPKLQDIVELSIDRHTCARHSDGRVRCWRRVDSAPVELALTNAIALVGSCAIDESGTQECAQEPPPPPHARGIRVPSVRLARIGAAYQASTESINSARAAARQHSTLPCVLRNNGSVGCWDVPSNVPPVAAHPSPDGLLEVEGIANAVQIATGHDFICGVGRDGGLSCTTAPYNKTPTIETATGLETVTDAVQVVAGRAHACARRVDGSVLCWGSNESGQLGAGSFDPTSSIVLVPKLRVVELAAGSHHTCGLTAQGEVWCWGYGARGQLGDAFTGRHKRTFASVVPGLPSVRHVVPLPGRTCAHADDGEVWCWGEGERTPMLEPICEPDLDGNVQCVLRGGGSSCGGRHVGERVNRARARRVDGGPFASIQRWGASLLALDSDGRVISFGELNPCDHRPDAMRADPTVLGTVPGSVELAAGGSVCVRTAAGAVLCAPRTDSGALAFAPIPNVEGALGITVGYRHACALLAGGQVTCWGDNRSGQLGVGTNQPMAKAAPVAGLDEVVEISAGWFHTCARRADGAVLCWGENEGGALGDGATQDRFVPTVVPELGRARAVAAHRWQSCAWQDDGALVCWGTRPSKTLELAPRPRRVVVLPT